MVLRTEELSNGHCCDFAKGMVKGDLRRYRTMSLSDVKKICFFNSSQKICVTQEGSTEHSSICLAAF